MTETWRRRVLYVAGAWNVVGGASALADPARPFAQLYGAALSLADPLQAFFFRATWINVIAWGSGTSWPRGARRREGPSSSRVGRASWSTSARAWRSSGAAGAARSCWPRACSTWSSQGASSTSCGSSDPARRRGAGEEIDDGDPAPLRPGERHGTATILHGGAKLSGSYSGSDCHGSVTATFEVARQ